MADESDYVVMRPRSPVELTEADEADRPEDEVDAGPMYTASGTTPLPPRDGCTYTLRSRLRGLLDLRQRLARQNELAAGYEQVKMPVPVAITRYIDALETEIARLIEETRALHPDCPKVL
eukprot:m.120012 g.120012  ORF g.120012 m.120012 type:complete len:120 (+) comp16170_c0_seq2:1612-1971(+)